MLMLTGLSTCSHINPQALFHNIKKQRHQHLQRAFSRNSGCSKPTSYGVFQASDLPQWLQGCWSGTLLTAFVVFYFGVLLHGWFIFNTKEGKTLFLKVSTHVWTRPEKLSNLVASFFTENSCQLGFSHKVFRNIHRNFSILQQHRPLIYCP